MIERPRHFTDEPEDLCPQEALIAGQEVYTVLRNSFNYSVEVANDGSQVVIWIRNESISPISVNYAISRISEPEKVVARFSPEERTIRITSRRLN